MQIELDAREEDSEFILLRDMDGVFLEIEPPSKEPMEEPLSGEEEAPELETLRAALAEARERNETLVNESKSMQEAINKEKERVREMWKMNCAQVAAFDEALCSKEAEISALRERISRLEGPGIIPPVVSPSPTAAGGGSVVAPTAAVSGSVVALTHEAHRRRGKAPPVSEFTGEDPEYILDDWLPSLERASEWNAWTADEKLIQFAGHLRGRALQEWNLLSDDDRRTFEVAVKSLHSRIDAGCKAVAAQDFRHLRQADSESVSDLIRRLERTFRNCVWSR